MRNILRNKIVLIFTAVLFFGLIVSALMLLRPQKIIIGFAGSLSGLNSDLSVSGRNGAMLAVNHINENGGINGQSISLVVKDDLNDSSQALAIDQEFAQQGINLIIGHMTSQMAENTVPFINAHHMLMISPTIAADSLSGLDDFFYRVIPSNKTQAKAISDQMISDGIKHAGVIIDKKNLLFSRTLRDFFITYFKAAGGDIVHSCEFESADILFEDCREIMTSGQVQGVFIIGASESFANIAQRMLQAKFSVKLYGPAWAMTSDLIEHGGASVEGTQFANYFDNSSVSPEYNSFRDAYITTYGNEPSFASYLAYEAVMILTDAIKGSGSKDPVILKQYLKAHLIFQGLDGQIQFDSFGDANRQLYIYQIKDGVYQIKN